MCKKKGSSNLLCESKGCRNHGYKCTPCLLHFQLCGCSAGADYGCNGCTKLFQQTELNVARGSVWGCSTTQSSGIRQSCYPLSECRIVTPFHFHWCPFVKEYALLLTNCTPCPQQLPASQVRAVDQRQIIPHISLCMLQGNKL